MRLKKSRVDAPVKSLNANSPKHTILEATNKLTSWFKAKQQQAIQFTPLKSSQSKWQKKLFKTTGCQSKMF